jgi:hypothetical protein
MQLSEHLGQEILLLVPDIDPKIPQLVKLIGVEAGGVWIESQSLTNTFLTGINQATWPGSPSFFLPYHAIRLGIGRVDAPALNEKAFGL